MADIDVGCDPDRESPVAPVENGWGCLEDTGGEAKQVRALLHRFAASSGCGRRICSINLAPRVFENARSDILEQDNIRAGQQNHARPGQIPRVQAGLGLLRYSTYNGTNIPLLR